QLKARDVKVREALELLLDLREAVREAAGDLFVLVDGRQQARLLALERVDLLQQVTDRSIARQLRLEGRVLLFEHPDLLPQALVLIHQLVGELGPAPKERMQEGVAPLLQIWRGARAGAVAPPRPAALLLRHGIEPNIVCVKFL